MTNRPQSYSKGLFTTVGDFAPGQITIQFGPKSLKIFELHQFLGETNGRHKVTQLVEANL